MSTKSKLLETIIFIIQNYPNPDHLSNSRLTKLVFLSDWKNCITTNEQITNIKWFFDHHGPYVDEIINATKSHTFFEVKSTKNTYGKTKNLISLKTKVDIRELTEKEKENIKFIISITKEKEYNDFINFVYSTFPIISSEKYSEINLIHKAIEYKSL